MRRLPTSSGRELTYVGRNCNWTISDPHAQHYLKRKGIELHRRASHSTTAPMSGANLISDKLLGTLPWGSLSIRRWAHLFGPRIQASLKRLIGQPPMLFPGSPIALDLLNQKSENNLLVNELFIDLFTRITAIPAAQDISRRPAHDAVFERLPASGWSWQLIEPPNLSRISLNNCTAQINSNSNVYLFQLLRRLTNQAARRTFKDQRLAEIRKIFEVVHTAWSRAAAPAYSESSLLVSEEIIARELGGKGNIDVIPLLFELESFAATEIIFQRMSPLASGMYNGLWLEIGTMPLHSILGTELCQSARLYDELISLANGHTAPLIVNEFGCLADGNHRLTAAWIWNILTACRNHDWSLGDAQFQKAVASVISSLNGKIGAVSLHEALHHLDVFLSDDMLRAGLVENLQNKHAMHPVSELPVIPLLEYSSLAVVGEPYSQSKSCIRFEPNTYEVFTKSNNVVLPARACYHFADRVPLPWFSIAGNKTRGGLIANKHHHWSSKHADDGADVAQTGA